MIIILDVKTISVRVHLVGTGGIGPWQILPHIGIIAYNFRRTLDSDSHSKNSSAGLRTVWFGHNPGRQAVWNVGRKAQQCHEKSKTFPKRPNAIAIDSNTEPLFLEGSRYAVCLPKLSLPFYICQKICGSFFFVNKCLLQFYVLFGLEH